MFSNKEPIHNEVILQTLCIDHTFEEHKTALRYAFFKYNGSNKWLYLAELLLGIALFFVFLWIIPESIIENNRWLDYIRTCSVIFLIAPIVHLVDVMLPTKKEFARDKKVINYRFHENYVSYIEDIHYVKSIRKNLYADYETVFESADGFFLAGKKKSENGTLYMPKSALTKEQVIWFHNFFSRKFRESFIVKY